MLRQQQPSSSPAATIRKTLASRHLVRGHPPGMDSWSRHIVGPTPCARDKSLVQLLTTASAASPKLADFLPFISAKWTPPLACDSTSKAVHVRRFQRFVCGPWCEGSRWNPKPTLPLGGAVVAIDTDVRLPRTAADLADRDRLISIHLTFCRVWASEADPVAAEPPRLSMSHWPGSRTPLSPMSSLAVAGADILFEAIASVSEALEALEEAQHDFPEYPAISVSVSSCPEAGEAGAALARALVTYLAKPRLVDSYSTFNDNLAHPDEWKFSNPPLESARAQSIARDLFALTQPSPPSAAASTPPGQHQSLVFIRDHVLQLQDDGTLLATRSPPSHPTRQVHWVLCVDHGTGTFFVEPCVPSEGRFDIACFLARAWAGSPTSLIRAKPHSLSLSSALLKSPQFAAITELLTAEGVSLAPMKSGGRPVSSARTWIKDIESVMDYVVSIPRDMLGSITHALMLAAHGAGLSTGHPPAIHLFWNQLASRAAFGSSSRAHSFYTTMSVNGYADYCRALDVDVAAEEGRIQTLLGQSAKKNPASTSAANPRSRPAETSRYVEIRATAPWSEIPLWRLLQVGYHSSLFDLYVAVCDAFNLPTGTHHEFAIPRRGEPGEVLLCSSSHRSDNMTPDVLCSEALATPGQRARLSVFRGWRIAFDLEVVRHCTRPARPFPVIDDLRSLSFDSYPPHCTGGSGASPIFADELSSPAQWNLLASAALNPSSTRSSNELQLCRSFFQRNASWPFNPADFSPGSVKFQSQSEVLESMYDAE